MQNQIAEDIKKQRNIFIFVIVIEFIICFFILLMKIKNINISLNIENFKLLFEYLTIILTFGTIPIIHYLYNKIVIKNKDNEAVEQKAQIYNKFNNLKLGLLTFAGIVNLFVMQFNYERQYLFMFLVIQIFLVITLPNEEKFLKDFTKTNKDDEIKEEIND